ncbi:MAG: hypothetical protein AAFW75_24185, partial [Cyanobacteria bacterium J06636_16]
PSAAPITPALSPRALTEGVALGRKTAGITTAPLSSPSLCRSLRREGWRGGWLGIADYGLSDRGQVDPAL